MGNPPLLSARKIWISNSFRFCHLYVLVSGQCLEDQKMLLLKFEQGLSFDPQSNESNKLMSWPSKTSCCLGDGVSCDPGKGHVIALDVSGSSITGGINSSSSLFNLHHLRSLNLADNQLYSPPFPLGFERLLKLTYLNLLYSGFSGQIPLGISSFRMLVSLDLSASNLVEPIQLRNADLEKLVKNLINLLYLVGIDLSITGSNWARFLSTLSNLRFLSLSSCNIVGPVHSSL